MAVRLTAAFRAHSASRRTRGPSPRGRCDCARIWMKSIGCDQNHHALTESPFTKPPMPGQPRATHKDPYQAGRASFAGRGLVAPLGPRFDKKPLYHALTSCSVRLLGRLRLPAFRPIATPEEHVGHVADIRRFCDGTLMRTDPGSDTKRKPNAFITIVEARVSAAALAYQAAGQPRPARRTLPQVIPPTEPSRA